MRWQKIARFAIAVFVIGFAIVVFLAMRPRPSTPSNANDVSRADPKALFESGPGVRKSFDFGKLGFELKYEKLLSYEGGRSKMGGVTLTLPDRNGRTLVVTADEGEFVAPGDTPAESADGKLNGHVKLTTDNGFEVLASEATYAGKTGILTIPGPVTFTKGRMKGSGVGATYDRNRDVIWLLAEARITVTPDAAGAGAIDGSASKAGLARADNFVKLEGTARLTTETRTAEADVITAYLDEKGEKVRTMELREHSRITSTGANADRMTARNIDLHVRRRRPHAAVLEADGRLGARVPGHEVARAPSASPGRRLKPACRPTARRSRTSPRRRTSRSICRWRATARRGGSNRRRCARRAHQGRGYRTRSSKAGSTSPKPGPPPARRRRSTGAPDPPA